MGDEGHLYVSEDVVPAYQALLRDADLILPNQFEAEYVRGLSNPLFHRFAQPLLDYSRAPQLILLQRWERQLPDSTVPTVSLILLSPQFASICPPQSFP